MICTDYGEVNMCVVRAVVVHNMENDKHLDCMPHTFKFVKKKVSDS